MKAEWRRREVVAGALALGACAGGAAPFAGEWLGPNMARGHAMRDGRLPAPTGTETAALVIAGGGVAGLAAGWRLIEAGFDDFLLLDIEDELGGNARAGANAVSAYPWGAHYLPVPNAEAKALRHMLRQFGMVVGEEAGAPVYDPYQLCADLEERLLWQGRWQEGLYPGTLSRADSAEQARFGAQMSAFRAQKGADGRPAFASPMAYSSQDPALRALDRVSFAAWLRAEGYHGAPLLAHIRYCCRDDYGSEPEAVSAWAGIHYFAGRRGWAGAGAGDNQLTWPEGNARLTRLMAERIGAARLRKAHAALHAEPRNGGAELIVHDFSAHRTRRLAARGAILALPDFVARRVLGQQGTSPVSYAPWVVANVTVSRSPWGPGVPLAWDNVSAASDSLGYVVATHQTSAAADGPTVLTWYTALSEGDPAAVRRDLARADLAGWQRRISADLLAMNPELEGAIERIDVWPWGHAMVRPTPGFLSRTEAPKGPIWRAHSDMSGLSLFEEAHYRGVAAAEAAMRGLGHRFESLLA